MAEVEATQEKVEVLQQDTPRISSRSPDNPLQPCPSAPFSAKEQESAAGFNLPTSNVLLQERPPASFLAKFHSRNSATSHVNELLRTHSVHSSAALRIPPVHVLQRSISDSQNSQENDAIHHHQQQLQTLSLLQSGPALSTPVLHRSVSRNITEELGSSPNSIHGFIPVATLGRGNKGTVVLVLAKQSGAPYALKITRRSNPSSAMTVKKQLQLLQQQRPYRDVEKEILASLHPHPFLQTLHAQFEVGKQYSVLVLDFCSGGDLHTLRHKQPEKRFSETAARFYAAEVLVALEHLHNMGIVYRDLKPENILIQENGHIKLTDFDLSLKLKPPNGKKEGVNQRNQLENGILADVVLEQDAASATDSIKGPNSNLLPGYNKSEVAYSRRFGGCFLASWNELEEAEEDENEEEEKEASDRFPGGEEESEDSAEMKRGGGTRSYVKWRRRIITRRNARKKRGDAGGMMTKNGNKQTNSKKKESICFVGTDEYVAPEVLKGEQHSTAMDCWSFGILLYEMIYGSTPFKGKTCEETLYNIMEKEAEFPGVKSSGKNLIAQLLVKDPSRRLGVQEIKCHGFFQGLQWEFLMDVARPPFIPPAYSMADLEEKAKRKQQRLTASINSCSNVNYCWIDEVVVGSSSAYINPSSSTHTQSSASSAFSLSSADSLHREDDLFSSQEWTAEMERQQSLRRA